MCLKLVGKSRLGRLKECNFPCLTVCNEATIPDSKPSYMINLEPIKAYDSN